MAEYLSGGRIQGSSAPLGDISKTGLKYYYKFDDSGAATRGKIAGGSQGGYTDWGRTAGTVNNGRDNLSYDLGATLNDTQWIMRFKLHIEGYELNSGSGCQVAIGMSDADADTAYETNQDSISFRIQFASGSSEQNFVANNSNGAEMGSNSVVIGTSMLASSTGKDYWVEIKRTGGTTGTVSIGENNDFTTGRTSVNLSSLSASTTGLRYFVSKVYDGQSNYVDNHVYGDVSEVKIYDNQSSATTVTYDVEDFMKSTSGWNINNASIQNIIPQTKDCINSASAVGSSDAVANSTIDLEYKAEGTRGATGKLGSAMSIVAGDAKGQASGTMRTDTAFLTNTGAVWTICLWVKVDARVGDQAWVTTTGLGSGEQGIFFRMQNSSGHIYLKFGTGGGTVIGGTATTQVIPDTNWNFVVGQYDYNDGAIKVSVNNGAFETVATAVISDTTTPYRQLIVGNSPELDNDLKGDMDELSIWNRILTADEITAIYNSGTGEVLNTVQAAGDPEKDSITNVPLGTRYEETDTRKIFRRTVAVVGDETTVSSLTDMVFDTASEIGDLTYSGNEITLSSDTYARHGINGSEHFQNSGTQTLECVAEKTGTSAWVFFGLASAKAVDEGVNSDAPDQMAYGIKSADDGRTWYKTGATTWTPASNTSDNVTFKIVNDRSTVTYYADGSSIGSTSYGTPAAAYYSMCMASQTGTAGSYTYRYSGDVIITVGANAWVEKGTA